MEKVKVKLTPKQKKRQIRIITDLTRLIKSEKAKFGGGNKQTITVLEWSW